MTRIGCLVCGASLLATSSVALAAGKYTKKEADIQATQTALTKPAQKAKDEKKRPNINADDVFGGVGEKVKSITDKQVQVLKRLVDNTNDTDPEKPDLLFRMAELYNEQQRYYNFRARELDQKIFDAKNKGQEGQARQMEDQQKDYQNKEKTWLLEAVRKYIEVADQPKFASYKKMDEVLFYLAYLLNQVKKEEGARKYFKRLIKDYPTSKFVPWAYLAFGEYFFEQKNFEDALKFYDKVMQYPQSDIYGYGMYKKGWVYFNLTDYKEALKTFVDVIELAHKGQGSRNKASRIQLEKEAKKDVVRAYSQIGTPDKAWSFFQRVGGEYAMTMLEQLGELYNGQGKFLDSIKVYRQLMALAPTSTKVCLWESEVVKNTLSVTGSRADGTTVKELQRLSAVYEKVKTSPALKPAELEECKDNTANTTRELATVWHKEAQKTNNPDTYSLAQYLYKEYLTRFPKEKDIYTMNWYFGELLFKLGSLGDNQKYCEAGPVYSDVVKANPQGKYLKEAAYASVLSWKNCLSVEDSTQDAADAHKNKVQEGKEAPKKSGAEKYAAKPIPDRWKKMIDAFDTYIKYVPDSPELEKIKYRKARVYYEYDHIDDAIPLFRDVVDDVTKKHKEDPENLAVFSANLLLDCYSIKKDFKTLSSTLDEFLATPALVDKDPEFKKQVGMLKGRVLRKEIESLEEDKKYKEAGDLYYQLATDYPDDPKIDEVYYNAALDYHRARLVGLAIKMRQQLITLRPNSNLAKKAIFFIGQDYQAIASYEAAAENYENFASKWPGEKDASAALLAASFFRRGLGENDKSVSDTNLFIKNYGGRHEFVDKAAGAAFGEAQIYEQQKDWTKLGKYLQDYLKQWGSKGGVDRQVIAHVKLGEIAWRQSCTAPGGGVNGACIEITRERAGGKARVAEKSEKAKKGKKGRHARGAGLPKQCGPETKSRITVFPRKPAQQKEALTHFAEALKLFKGGAAIKNVPGKDEAERSDRANLMTYHAAEARMMEGDLDYEKFLGMKIPDKLDFSPAPPGSSAAKEKAAKKRVDESKKKFSDWLKSKDKLLTETQKIYQNVILFKNAHWAIAASARIGQLFQDFSGQLYTAPVPKAGAAPAGYPQEDYEQLFHDAYCDQMTDTAEPLENKAIQGLGTCLSKSTDLSWFNEWSKLCEEELNQLKPSEYPLASEIRAEPGYVAVSADQAPVMPLESN